MAAPPHRSVGAATPTAATRRTNPVAALGRSALQQRPGHGLLVGGIGGLLHGIVETFGVQTGVVERIAATAVRQRQFGGYANVLLVDGGGPAPRGVRHRGSRDHEISAHAVDVERRTQRRDAP